MARNWLDKSAQPDTEVFDPFDDVLGSTLISRLGEIIRVGVLDPSLRQSWRSIRTAEERYLACVALRYTSAIGAVLDGTSPEVPSQLAGTILETTVDRLLSIDERATVSRAVDILGSADAVTMSADPELSFYAGYVAPAMYAQGFRLPRNPAL